LYASKLLTEATGPGARFFRETLALYKSSSTTERSYYPIIRELWSRLLEQRGLPFEVRAETSERRTGGPGADLPDLALYDRGEFVAVFAEVKTTSVSVEEMAVSTERNDQVGRYLSQTGVVLLCNVRAVGLLACKPGYQRTATAVPLDQRELLETVDLWPTEDALKKGKPIEKDAIAALGELLERAVTEFAPVADPLSLARILARQARRAKADLPERFESVASLLEDYRKALGLTFDLETEKGAEFFRSSLIQTAYYGLFAGWTLWHRAKDGAAFRWDHMDTYLRIPFLGKLFYEFKHPDRLAELRLAPHLDRATATLGRVDRGAFFSRFSYPSLNEDRGDDTRPTAALTYFYEPFLEAFDPDLRKELGVWYTPPDIVRYQVRKVDQILRKHLSCPRGFADPRVVVLDPCCGTAAYLLEVVRRIAADIRSRGDESVLGAELLQAVSTRVIGFEILTAPFVIAQLQLFHVLSDVGATVTAKHRPAVFLTNALAGWEGPEQIKLNFPELQQEHEAARRVKRDAKIIVVLGNPPYNRFAGTALDEEADLVDHYKGIRRRAKQVKKKGTTDGTVVMVQVGESQLYTRWGIRKQLLDDLYVRFFRLAEKRIGEKAEYGIVSLISNSSYLTGRSHPLMRESLLGNFHEVWIDNVNGDKYRTGKIIPAGLPGAGTSDQSIFTTDHDASGIQVGTCISTLLKRRALPTSPDTTPIHHRDFWGKADLKRRALLESLDIDRWEEARKAEAAVLPCGPREYETFFPRESSRWMFSPRDSNVGYEAWPALDELFPVCYQGVNPNRGLEGSVIDTDRERLSARMKAYFSATSFDDLEQAHPALVGKFAGYDSRRVWENLRKTGFDKAKIVAYQLFPLDSRSIYYETRERLLNRPRPELANHVSDNEFFVTVPQPRRASEIRPVPINTLFDLHLHDRGSVGFPREVRAGDLFDRSANLDVSAWHLFRSGWRLPGTDLHAATPRKLVSLLFRAAIAVLHAPQYQADHQDALAQDWAHLPIPKDKEVFDQMAALGDKIAVLLDPMHDADAVVSDVLGKAARTLGVIRKRGASQVSEDDLVVSVAYYGAAKGKWVARAYANNESQHPAWGATTGDLYINPDVHFANVPEAVWRYELGGYPVLRKWLGYHRRLVVPVGLSPWGSGSTSAR
jgi:Type ISP C-terminal specificity domain/N-6 DNA Methylase